MHAENLSKISAELESLVGAVTPFLVHIGSEGVPFRTGIVWDEHQVVTPAVFARDGEEVTMLTTDGKQPTAVVQAFDSTTGIALLKTEEALPVRDWAGGAPRLGALAVSVARPSPAGPEARLEMVRCVEKGYFQTDGAAFPGFGGAAVLGPEGRLWGMVSSNASGNRGLVLPYAELRKTIEELERTGSKRRRVLGVRTQATEGGLLVVGVDPDSAAHHSGVLVGDILKTLGGRELSTSYELLAALESGERKLDLALTRGGQALTLPVEPRTAEPGGAPAWRGSRCCGR